VKVSADQARALADQFLALAETVKHYRLAKRRKLAPARRQKLKDAELKLRDQSSDLTTAAVGLTLVGVQTEFKNLMTVTAEANQAIASIQAVKQVVNIATAALKLGAAFATKDPAAIAAAVNDLQAEVTA
jgi:hypothetical protein